MEEEKFFEQFKDIPNLVESSILMTEANSPLKIYEGEFSLRNEQGEITIDGCIYFNWGSSSGPRFKGEISKGSSEYRFSSFGNFEVVIDGLVFGWGFITKSILGVIVSVTGVISGEAVFGDKSIAVEKIIFSVPNFRDFDGMLVKKINGDKLSTSRNRLVFENETYEFFIDKCMDYKSKKDSLAEKGGYIILYNGELKSKKGSLKREDTQELFYCLSTFMSFLNGKRTSAIFHQGIFENEVIWCDYTEYFVDIHKEVRSWPQSHSITGLNDIWINFSTLWKKPEDRNFLISAIHWYVEANGHSGFSEGSIIMAQTALELLYNWWVIERKQLILGKDSENISAANKIRLLLSQLNISLTVPESFIKLREFVDSNKDIMDAPDAVVQIRNAIVHSQEEKRKKLSAIHHWAKFEALQLCTWYIEMALLRILDFDDKYFNRCSGERYKTNAEEFVPWSKKEDTPKPD